MPSEPEFRSISFTVYGQAQPAGSKRRVPIIKDGRTVFHRVIDDNPKSAYWKHEVKQAAIDAMDAAGFRELFTGAIVAEFVFHRVRPKGHYKANGELKASAPSYPTTKPDLLKTARGIEDALQGLVYLNDAQICDELLRKHFGGQAAVTVTITEME